MFDAIEENLPEDEDQSEWNWEALAKLRQHALEAEPPRSRSEEDRPRRARRDADRAGPRGDRADRSERRRAIPGRRLRRADGLRAGCSTSSASSSTRTKSRARTPRRSSELVREKAAAGVRRARGRISRCMAGLYHFTTRDAQRPEAGRPRRVWWPGPASGSTSSLNLDDLKNRQRDEIRKPAGRAQPGAARAGQCQRLDEVHRRVDKLFNAGGGRRNGRGGQRRQRRA